MSPLLHVKGPADAGAGERQEMLERAKAFFGEHSVEDVVRVDVPGRGGSEGTIEGASLRHELEPLIPALQSTSLFGTASGLQVVDAQNLLAGEAVTVAQLLERLDPRGQVVAVLLSAGAIPAAVAKVVRSAGTSITVKKMRERDAVGWLQRAASERGVEIEGPAAAALVQRFGSDVAALGQALDQLVSSGNRITRQEVLDRFRNRPDEPMWHYSDAVAAGKTGEALRRLADFLTHGHPLQLLGFLEADLRRRAIAGAAPDQVTLAEALGASADDYRVTRAWREGAPPRTPTCRKRSPPSTELIASSRPNPRTSTASPWSASPSP